MKRGIKELFTKYYHNFCSQEELNEVMGLLSTGRYSDQWEAMLEEETIHLIGRNCEKMMSGKEIRSLNKRIRYTIKETEHRAIKSSFGKFWLLMCAAAIILTMETGIYFYTGNFLTDENQVEFAHAADIARDKNGALLAAVKSSAIACAPSTDKYGFF